MTVGGLRGIPAFFCFMGIAEAVNWTVFGLCCYFFHYKQITGISEMETMLSVGPVLHIAVTAGFYIAFAEHFALPDRGEMQSTIMQVLIWISAGIVMTFTMFALLFFLIPRLQSYGSEYDGLQYLIFGLLFHGGTAAAMIVLRIGRYLVTEHLAKK